MENHYLFYQFFFVLLNSINCAILPPPWANPKLNPCATQPDGWQLLFWPPDGQCYKIFKMGYPCPDDMELTPPPTYTNQTELLIAECKCPPMQAQSRRDGKCYELFTIGPCDITHYFAPIENSTKWGQCLPIPKCKAENSYFWPRDSNCYAKNSKGPCPKGQLIVPFTTNSKLAQCKCSKHPDFDNYRHSDDKCYEHFTKGPCKEIGHLYLPNKSCGCHSSLPHFHRKTENCYELNTIGPCASGEIYQIEENGNFGQCQCKTGYIRYNSQENNKNCYRPFTEGPCGPNKILLNSTKCIRQPCKRGQLYFAELNRCYRIGTRGPCEIGRIVTFDFSTRPSIDGISFNGVCSCQKYVLNNDCVKKNDKNNEENEEECDFRSGMIKLNKRCFKLYTQGPCKAGEWLVPNRQSKQLWTSGNNEKSGRCECMPGYTKVKNACLSPTVLLADFLNRNINAK